MSELYPAIGRIEKIFAELGASLSLGLPSAILSMSVALADFLAQIVEHAGLSATPGVPVGDG